MMPGAEAAQPGMPPFMPGGMPGMPGMPGMQMAPPGAMRGGAYGAPPGHHPGMPMGWRPGIGQQMLYPPQQGGAKKPLKRKERDPNRVPRPKSAYNLFMKVMVGRLKREHPTVAHKEAFKEAARLWTLSPRDGSTPLDSSNFAGPPSDYILTEEMKEALRGEAAGSGAATLALGAATSSAAYTGLVTTGAEAGAGTPSSAVDEVDEPAEEEEEEEEEGVVEPLAAPPPVEASSEPSEAEASDSAAGQLPTSEGAAVEQDAEDEGGEAAKRVKAEHEGGHPILAEL